MLKIFRKLLGYKYLVNVKTGEVHVISKITGACGVHNMAEKNKMYVTEEQYPKLEVLSKKLEVINLNGCVHCNKEKNTD